MTETAESPPTAAHRAWAAIERALSTTEGWVMTGIVLVLAAVGEIILLHGSQAEEVYIPAVVMAAPVTFVRRLPRTAAVISTLATVSFAGDTSASWPVASVLGLMLVLGAAAYELAGRRSFVLGLPLPALLIGSVFVVNAAAPMNGDDPGAGTFLLLILVTASMTFGALYRSRRAAVTERDATLQAHAVTLREQSLIEERTRIARELHDVVAHHISSIAIQAETARFTTPGLPELGAERFAAIGDSARSALDEMRRLLGVVRAPRATPELAPQPGLDQIDHLIDDTRALGTEVRFTVSGNVTALSEDIELVAYRIAQEALTNARRHASGAAVDVTLEYDADALTLAVRDHGPGAGFTGDAGGFGMVGMRERAAAVGGTLAHRDHPDGGFEVVARIPIQGTT
jgi:signal transduction histidine kinase